MTPQKVEWIGCEVMSQPQLPRFVGLRRQVSDAIGPRTPIVSTWRKVPNLFYSFLQGAGLATGDLKQTVPLLPPPFYFRSFFFLCSYLFAKYIRLTASSSYIRFLTGHSDGRFIVFCHQFTIA